MSTSTDTGDELSEREEEVGLPGGGVQIHDVRHRFNTWRHQENGLVRKATMEGKFSLILCIFIWCSAF